MGMLENNQAVLQACQRLRQAPEDKQSNIAASIFIARRHLRMDDALRAVADDAVYVRMCLSERPGALERLKALTCGQTA